jgi:hypothetical protein
MASNKVEMTLGKINPFNILISSSFSDDIIKKGRKNGPGGKKQGGSKGSGVRKVGFVM